MTVVQLKDFPALLFLPVLVTPNSLTLTVQVQASTASAKQKKIAVTTHTVQSDCGGAGLSK